MISLLLLVSYSDNHLSLYVHYVVMFLFLLSPGEFDVVFYSKTHIICTLGSQVVFHLSGVAGQKELVLTDQFTWKN